MPTAGSIPAPRGKVLGGSNSVNGLMYMRGCPADYDDWESAGLPGWGYAGVLPYFRRSETNWRGASRFHGGTGPLTTARYETDDFIYPRVIDTAEALGFRHLEDFHGEDDRRILRCRIVNYPRRRARQHGGALPAAGDVARPISRCASTRWCMSCCIENGRCVGVRARIRRRQSMDIRCRARGDPLRRHLQFAAVAAALGHRRARRPRAAWHPRAPCAARRGRQPAGSPVDGGGSSARAANSVSNSELRLDRLALSVLQWKMFRTGPVARSPICGAGTGAHARRTSTARTCRCWCRRCPFSRGRGFPAGARAEGHRISMPACCCIRKAAARCRCVRPIRSAKPSIQLNLLQAEADRARPARHRQFVRRFFARRLRRSWWAGSSLPGPTYGATRRSMPGCAPMCAPPCIPPAPAPWVRMRWRLSMGSCECTGCRDCASPMRR